MKRSLITVLAVLLTLSAKAQPAIYLKKNKAMLNTDIITNENVKKAVEALQAGEAAGWFKLFTPGAVLYDDGHQTDFRSFFTVAMGHEYFTVIDKVENNGSHIYGKFHSDQWGDFKTYFKFHTSADGKFDKLEIGQACY